MRRDEISKLEMAFPRTRAAHIGRSFQSSIQCEIAGLVVTGGVSRDGQRDQVAEAEYADPKVRYLSARQAATDD